MCVLGKLKPNPNLVEYDNNIEECVSTISEKISVLLPENKQYLKRWVSLKLIDGDDKILDSISENIFLNNRAIEISNFSDSKLTKNFKDNIVSSILYKSESVQKSVCSFNKSSYNSKDRKIDKIITSKYFGIPIMLSFLAVIFWITIVGANYPSGLLSDMFGIIGEKISVLFTSIHLPNWLIGILIDGVYTTLTWVISVMLPPMAIFFPIFTLLEDLGFLPRIAFNLDKYFKKACSSGKQALTMCMGFGCNAAGVVGCRIIDSPREKLLSILTNAFVPCNRTFSFFNNYCNGIYWRICFWFCIFNSCYCYSFISCNFRNIYDIIHF